MCIVTAHHPGQGQVSYARITRRSYMGLLHVSYRYLCDCDSRITVSRWPTALSAEGAMFVKWLLDNKHFKRDIGEWRRSLEGLLQSLASNTAGTGE